MWETRKLIPEKSYKQTRHCIFVLMLFSYLIIFWFNQPIRNAHLSIFLWPYVVYCVDAVGMTNLNLKHSLSLFCQRGSVWQFSFILITGGKGTWVPKIHIVLFAYKIFPFLLCFCSAYLREKVALAFGMCGCISIVLITIFMWLFWVFLAEL